jgi:uncharacterized membrane protein
MTMQSSTSDTRSVGQRGNRARRLGRWIFPLKPPPPINPALVRHAEERAQNAQNRVADRITEFAGSMAFVYLHVIWFACWIGFGVERYPFGLLTMIVSLEAIFLSTFVMISQNRADAKRQVLADQQWRTVQEEERQNVELLSLARRQDEQAKELLGLSNQTLALTKEVRSFADLAREDHEQNEQLLDLSKRTLALTQEVHSRAGAAGSTDAGVSGAQDGRKTDS